MCSWKDRKGQKEFCAEQGEALFIEPVATVLDGLKASAGPSYQIVESAKDDRSKAILRAIVVESNLDSILKIWLPGFDKLVEDKGKELTFSMKISFLRSMNLIPEQILDAADRIRDVRNAFAHKLEINDLDQLDGKIAGRLTSLYNRIFGASADKTRRDHHDALIKFAVHGLRAYAANVQVLRNALISENFVSDLLGKENGRQAKALEDILKSQQPMTSITVGASSVDVYPSGITVVSVLDPTKRS